MIKKLLWEKGLSFAFFLVALCAAAQTPYTLTHGFGGAVNVPAGITVQSYDGATACSFSSNGANAVTTLVLKAQPGYEFTVTAVTGTGVRSNAGPNMFRFRVVNNGTVMGPESNVTNTSSCGSPSPISALSVPEANQLVTSNNTISIQVPRYPNGPTGGGYSHVVSLNVTGVVRLSAPVATAATDVTTAGFTANWNTVQGATGYRLDVSATPDFSEILEDYDNVAVPGLSLFVHLGIQPGTIYWYRVRAENGSMTSADSNIITAIVPECGVVSLPTAQPQLFCGTATVAGLMATGAGTFNWYDAETGGNQLTSATALATGTYYVSQVVANCESTRVAVAVTVNPVPAMPETVIEQLFCESGTVAELQALTGESLLWYAAPTGGEPLAADTPLAVGNYYVSQTVNGCESLRNVSEVSILEIPAAPVAAAQLFCGSGLVSGLTAEGEGIKWYATETGTDVLTGDTTLATGTYYVSQTITGCESPRTPVAVTVNTVPELPVAVAQNFCGSGTVGELAAEGTALLWYAAETGGEPLTEDAALTTDTYYVTQTLDGCESPRLAVEVNVYEVPSIPQISTQTFCGTATAAALEATVGENTQWYTALIGGEPLEADATLATGIYYVSQTVNGCESARIAFIVLINPIPAAPAAEAQTFCGATTAADLTSTGVATAWYDAADATTALTSDAAIATGTYYVSQTINGCESDKTAVAVTVNAIPAAPVADAQTFCGQALVSQLESEGAAVLWYADETSENALNGSTILSSATYYATQTINGCESPRTAVDVTVNAIPDAPAVSSSTVSLCNDVTIADLEAEGENIAWYAAATGGEALEPNVAIGEGLTVYYASQTVNGCESPRTALAVQHTVAPAPEGEAEQDFTEGETVADLEVTGGNITWYSDANLTNEITTETVLEDGAIYYAAATVGECTSDVLAVTANLVLATDGFEKHAFAVYPNPVDNVLNVTSREVITGIAVYNMLGQQVLLVHPGAEQVTLDMANLAAETYFVKISAGDTYRIFKIVKN
ncbi:T9SS type A sorting domain-containing protein [Flavobacterium sp. RHBU_24]|uniref:Ig-like domain-containing protein n=1 Tax=Flavobacterium sp. RHBU_24 TaxID=3391185 RepID=UPI003984D98B